jgi:RHS repeat-associated protein
MSSRPTLSFRVLSSLISVCLGINLIGVPIATAAQKDSSSGIQPVVGEMPSKPPKAKMELTSKRTKYSTRYANTDGSFTEEVYLVPQFYQDQTDKKWKKIQSNLKVSSKKAGKFENTTNDFSSWFSNESGTGELVSVEKEGKSISLEPVQAKKVKGTVNDQTITYSDIYPNTDIRYRIENATVKEDIILKSKPEQDTFTFQLNVKGIEAKKLEDDTIVFADNKGNSVFRFVKPFMVDATGKQSFDVQLELRNENGGQFVDVIPDRVFLETAKYPVTIDPPITSIDVVTDTYVYQNDSSWSYDGEDYMDVGQSYGSSQSYSLVKFALPTLPSSSSITNASFYAYQTNTSTTSDTIGLYRISSDWSWNVTWRSQPSIYSTPISSTTDNKSEDYWKWDITSLVQGWYGGAYKNYGFLLKPINDNSEFLRSFLTTESYSSSDPYAVRNTPKLEITYSVDPIGLEKFWTYTEDGVNPVNGNLVFQEVDATIPGRGVPISLIRTYNSRKSGSAGLFGYGWTTNCETKIIDTGNTIVLMDGDNTGHIFGEKLGGGYTSPPGIYLELVKNADGTYTITQKDKTKINFNTSGQLISIVDKDGNSTSVSYNGAGKISTITDPSGRTLTFAYGTNGYVSSITDPANRSISYGYDTAGNLITVTEAGFTTRYGYDTYHNLTSLTDARNLTTTIVYDTSDRVSSIKRNITKDGVVNTSTTNYYYVPAYYITATLDGESRQINYSYNQNGNVEKIEINPNDAANKSTTTYTYDDNQQVTSVKNPNNQSSSLAYVFSYDSNGNVKSVTSPENNAFYFSYDEQNNLTKEKDPNGQETKYDYDEKNNQKQATDPYVQTVSKNYDDKGNIVSYSHPMSAADNKVTNSSFEFDGDGNQWPDKWTQIKSTESTATFGWTTPGKVGIRAISITNPTAKTTVQSDVKIPYVYANDYVLSGFIKTSNVTGKAYAKVEALSSSGNVIAEKVSYQLTGTHDWTRVQVAIHDLPNMSVVTHLRVSVEIDSGSGTAYFDGIQLEKGAVLSSYNLLENGGFDRDEDGNSVPDYWTTANTTIYDGRVANTNPPEDETIFDWDYSYKFKGEKGKNKYIKQHVEVNGDASTPLTISGWSKQEGADPAGGAYNIQVAVNYLDGTTGWFGNDYKKTAKGWQHLAVSVTPQKPFSSIDIYLCYYDQLGTAKFDGVRLEYGSVLTTVGYDPNKNYVTSVTSPMGNTVSYTSDIVGNNTTFTDAKGNNYIFDYDNRDLLTTVTDPNGGITSYGYDGVGNRKSVTDSRNYTTLYDHNEFNQIAKITNPLNQVTQFDYDLNGNNTKVTQANGNVVSYTYNNLNRMDGIYYNGVKQWDIAYDPNGNIKWTADQTGLTTNYSYDKDDRLTNKSIGSSNTITYKYDKNGNLKYLDVYNHIGWVIKTAYKYNWNNQMISVSAHDNVQASYVYDERGNVISVTKPNTYTWYQYDSNNRLISVHFYVAGVLYDFYKYTYDANGNPLSIETDEGTITYQYDKTNRLTQETLLDGSVVTYEYDLAGNRTKKTVSKDGTSTTTVYTHDAANQLKTVDGQAYVYDANGNLTNDEANTYVYDAANRLIEVKDATGASIATFTYDHDGKRTSITTATGTTKFYWSGDKVLYETDANNNITAEYTWDMDGNPVSMRKGGNTYYYVLNGHGDVTGLTDENGTFVARYVYDAWGNIVYQTGSMAAANPYRYAGYRYDETTKFYYLMSRYYDPSVGRFITRDTFQGVEDDPRTLNLYAYGNNNPVVYIDPDGHWVWAAVNLAFAVYEGYQAYKAGADWKGIAVGAIVGGLGGRYLKVGKTAVQKLARKLTTKAYSLSNKDIKHIRKHIPSEFKKQLAHLPKDKLEKTLAKNSFFNPNWSNEKVASALNKAYNDAMAKGITNGHHRYKVYGETIEIYIKDGQFKTGYGLHKLDASYFGY